MLGAWGVGGGERGKGGGGRGVKEEGWELAQVNKIEGDLEAGEDSLWIGEGGKEPEVGGKGAG